MQLKRFLPLALFAVLLCAPRSSAATPPTRCWGGAPLAHLWSSPSARLTMRAAGAHPQTYAIIDGKIVAYDLTADTTKTPLPLDARYLGLGRYCNVEQSEQVAVSWEPARPCCVEVLLDGAVVGHVPAPSCLLARLMAEQAAEAARTVGNARTTYRAVFLTDVQLPTWVDAVIREKAASKPTGKVTP